MILFIISIILSIVMLTFLLTNKPEEPNDTIDPTIDWEEYSRKKS